MFDEKLTKHLTHLLPTEKLRKLSFSIETVYGNFYFVKYRNFNTFKFGEKNLLVNNYLEFNAFNATSCFLRNE